MSFYPFPADHPHFKPPAGFAPCTRPLNEQGYHAGPCSHPFAYKDTNAIELEQYRLAVPQLVEEVAALQKRDDELENKLRDERTLAQFWKTACGLSLQLNEDLERVAEGLRDRIRRACRIALVHLDEDSTTQLERQARAELNALLTEVGDE